MKLENKVSKCQKRCAPRQHLFDTLTVLSIVSIEYLEILNLPSKVLNLVRR